VQQIRQGLPRVRVILDDRNAFPDSEMSNLVLRLCPNQWESQRKCRSFPEPLAVRLDLATVHLGEGLGERKPDADSPGSAIERSLRLREQVEDVGQHLGSDANASVLHSHHHPALLLSRDKPNRLRIGREFDGVRENVRNDLSQAGGITVNYQDILGQLDFEALRFGFDGRAARFNGVAHCGLERYVLALQLDLAVCDSVYFQEVIKQPSLVACLPLDDLRRAFESRVREERTTQRARGVQNRCKRISQLVRQHRKEPIFCFVAFPKLLYHLVTLLLWFANKLLDRCFDAPVKHIEEPLPRFGQVFLRQTPGLGLEILDNGEDYLTEERQLPECLRDVVTKFSSLVPMIGGFLLDRFRLMVAQNTNKRIEERRKVIVEVRVGQVQPAARLFRVGARG
jgi:hypothetical protein